MPKIIDSPGNSIPVYALLKPSQNFAKIFTKLFVLQLLCLYLYNKKAVKIHNQKSTSAGH